MLFFGPPFPAEELTSHPLHHFDTFNHHRDHTSLRSASASRLFGCGYICISCTFFLLCMARIINRKLLSCTSTLYSDGYLQPVAQHSVQRSTVNTTSLISIVADEARDNSGRTEPDTVPADKHSLRAEAVMCRECLAALGIFRRGYRHFFFFD